MWMSAMSRYAMKPSIKNTENIYVIIAIYIQSSKTNLHKRFCDCNEIFQKTFDHCGKFLIIFLYNKYRSQIPTLINFTMGCRSFLLSLRSEICSIST